MTKFVSYVPDEAIEKDAQALLAEYPRRLDQRVDSLALIQGAVSKSRASAPWSRD